MKDLILQASPNSDCIMYKSVVTKDAFHPETQAFFNNKKVLVTGGTGFIGSHLIEQLISLHAQPIIITRQKNPIFLSHLIDQIDIRKGDLLDYSSIYPHFIGCDVVINLAAMVAGLEYNQKHPATIYHHNTQLFLNAIQAAKNANVTHFTTCSSACVYPRFCSLPTPEIEGMKDEPEPTNAGYGWAKRMQEFLSQQYANEFGMMIAIPRPYNAYGPRDNFNPISSHVIPALIRKAFETKTDYFDVWGNGEHSRSFLYVDDFARGIIEVSARYACHDPINIGADEEVTIKSVANMIADIVSHIRHREIQPRFLTSGLTGQPRRRCDTTKIARELQYQTHVSLCDGLKKTIEWYIQYENRVDFTDTQ